MYTYIAFSESENKKTRAKISLIIMVKKLARWTVGPMFNYGMYNWTFRALSVSSVSLRNGIHVADQQRACS